MTDRSADSPLWLAIAAETETATAKSSLETEVAGLFHQLRSPLLRYVFSLGLSAADGEEVVQDVFLSLFQHLRHNRSRENLRGWLFRVAHNLALKRRAANRDVHSDETVLQRHAANGPNPEEALAARQRQARLLAVVRALPESDRCCLHLRAEGLRYREIAEILGISLGAVSLALSRSLARISRADASSEIK